MKLVETHGDYIVIHMYELIYMHKEK